jgi:hypothetical protein
MNTSGWEFWLYADEVGKKHALDEARKRSLEMKGGN